MPKQNNEPKVMASLLITVLKTMIDTYGDLPIYLTHEWTEALELSGIQYYEEGDGQYDYFPERIELM